MSSDDHKFPFLNKNSDSNEDDDSSSPKSPQNNESNDEDSKPLLPWQKKSFGKSRDTRNNDRDKKPRGDKGRGDDRSRDRRGSDDGDKRRPFGDREGSPERKSWGDKGRGDDRSRDSRGSDDGDKRRSFGDKEGSSERKPRGDKGRGDDRSRDSRGSDDGDKRRSFGDREGSSERKPWGDKGRGDDRSRDSRGSDDGDKRRSFGDREGSPERRPWGDKGRGDDRSRDSRGSDGGDKRRSFGDREGSPERKPWGDKGRGDDRSSNRRSTNNSGFTKPWTDRKDFEQSGFGTNDDMRRYDDRDNEIKPARIESTKTKIFDDFAQFYLGDKNEVVPPSKESKIAIEGNSLIDAQTTFTGQSSNDKDEETKGRKRIVKQSDREFGRRRDRPEKAEVSINYGEDANGEEVTGVMRLNKFIAKTGLCSRRKAADLVKDGEISVNGQIEIQPAYEVQDTDIIMYQGKKLEVQEELVYLLLNKPKGYITTMDDERDRKTVMDLVEDKVDVRIFPVGRLDRNTSGLLLFTNDGDLTKVLSHPSHKVQKFYHVVLDKPVSEEHLAEIRAGLILEDGKAEVDAIGYVDGKNKEEVGIEIHIGKNRIVRRLFEHFGYRVEKLDRTYYAGLTKKDLSRGWSRHLTHKEVIMLKHFTGK